MLQVVDDQHFGGAQFFLEGERVLAIERAQEVAHEVFRAQEQRALAALAEFQRGGIQQMGFAETEPAMDVEQRYVAVLAFGERPCCAEAEFIGWSRDKAVEGLLWMKHARPKSAAGVAGRFVLGGARDIAHDRWLVAHRLADQTAADDRLGHGEHDRDRHRLGALRLQRPFDARHIMV